jgi:predicted proteasome-type protease
LRLGSVVDRAGLAMRSREKRSTAVPCAHARAPTRVSIRGNFIESTLETPYFQLGESKYGKPILDRVITTSLSLNEAAKCALVLQSIRSSWGQQLRKVFDELPNPQWWSR